MTAYDIASRLPPIEVLRDRCRALAVLERILDRGEPYYDYTAAWGEDEAAFMTNGSGDEYAIVFTSDGVFIRVLAHESEMWPGLLDGLPDAMRPMIEEPAFADEDGRFVATAVLWRLVGDDRWHVGDGIAFPPSRGPYDVDGSGRLEILLDDIVDRYVDFAARYYEVAVDRAAVAHVVAHRPLTGAVVRALNPEATIGS